MIYLISLGANAEHSLYANSRRLAHVLGDLPGRVLAVSRLYRTSAWPPGNGPDFANAAAMVTFRGPPKRFLAELHRVEARHGRVRHRRWGARSLDLDLVAGDGLVRPDVATWRVWRDLPQATQARMAPEDLILPHPRVQDRAFVLLPLRDIAPGWRHPVTGRSVHAMCADLTASARLDVRLFRWPDGVVNTGRLP